MRAGRFSLSLACVGLAAATGALFSGCGASASSADASATSTADAGLVDAGSDTFLTGDVGADTGAHAVEPGGEDFVAYRPVVDLWNIQTFAVTTDHGGPLMVGHPVHLHVEVDVQAQPYQTDAWYGLQSADGQQFCVIDHVAIDHLGAVYAAAERANTTPPESDVPPPSLTPCDQGQVCAAGETCTPFTSQSIDGQAPTIDKLSDPNAPVPHTTETGPAPADAPVVTQTTYLCATPEWVAHAAAQPRWVTPADLAGTVRQVDAFGAVDELPVACAALAGQSGVTAWVAFDPEESTQFAQRPALPQYHADPDAGPTATVDDAGSTWDPAHVAENDAARAFAQRLAMTAPVGIVLADAGLDVNLRTLSTGSSVVTLHDGPHPGGDFHVDLDYSLDGKPTPDQQAALTGAQVKLHFTLVPVGAPRLGCTPTDGNDPGEPMPIEIVHAENGQGTEVAEEPLANLALGVEHDRSFALTLPTDVRQAVFQSWACWDKFAVQACETTTLPETTMAQPDDCVSTSVIFLRETPPPDAEMVDDPLKLPPPPAPLPPPPATGCDSGLLKTYADLMKKHYELENGMNVADFYTFDIVHWMGSKMYPPGWGPGHYITEWTRWGNYMNHLKSFLQDCEAKGNKECWTVWGYKNSPWNIDVAHYQNKFIPYFYNVWDGSSGNYQRYKRDAQLFVKEWFAYDCPGIATGSICSEINYDLTRVPELAARIKDVLTKRKFTDPLAPKIRSTEIKRCILNSYESFERMQIDANGAMQIIPDDEVFFTSYLTHVCTKGKYKADADKVWQQVVTTCNNVAKPFPDSGTGISTGRFIPELYKTYDSGYKLGVKGVAEGGILNDYAVNNATGAFKLQFGAQGRIYLGTDPDALVAGWLDVYDIFKVWLVGNFYSDILSSNIEAGFHVLTNDIWKITYKIPQGEFELPNPPELAKEKEKCKYLFKPPIPFRIEICGSVGGKAFLQVGAKVLKSGLEGTSAMNTDWPGVAGVITPGVAITTGGRAGIDVWVASAGLVVKLDPTFEVSIPVTVGAKWNMTYLAKVLQFTIQPFVMAELKLRALGGSLAGYTRWKLGAGKEEEYPIVDWEALDIGGLVGKKWILMERNWSTTGKVSL